MANMVRCAFAKIRLTSVLQSCGKLKNSHLPISTNMENNTRSYGSLYEPEYLKLLEPEFPSYDVINVQMKGYDFTVLEHYAKYVGKTALHLKVELEDSWPIPGKKLQIQSYASGTIVVKEEFQLSLYERNVQVSNVVSITAPIFLEMIENALPAGVQISIHYHAKEHEDERYIPDLELRDLRKELETYAKPKRN